MNETRENIQTKKSIFFGMNELKQQVKGLHNKSPMSIFNDNKVLGLYTSLNKNIFDLTKEIKKLGTYNKPTIVKRENINELMLKELRDISKVEKGNIKLLKGFNSFLSKVDKIFSGIISVGKLLAIGAGITFLLTTDNKFIAPIRDGIFGLVKKIGGWIVSGVNWWWKEGGGKEGFDKVKEVVGNWIVNDFWPFIWDNTKKGFGFFIKELKEGSKIAWASAGIALYITGLWKPILFSILKLLGNGLKGIGILLYENIKSIVLLGRKGISPVVSPVVSPGIKTVVDSAGRVRYAKGTVIGGVKVGGRFVAKEGAEIATKESGKVLAKSITKTASKSALKGIKAVGGKAPIVGGLISGGITLATGGSVEEAVGSAIGTTLGTVVGGAIGSVVPGAGTAIGAVVGGVLGDLVGSKIGKLFENKKQKVEKQYDKVIENNEKLIKKLDENTKAINENTFKWYNPFTWFNKNKKNIEPYDSDSWQTDYGKGLSLGEGGITVTETVAGHASRTGDRNRKYRTGKVYAIDLRAREGETFFNPYNPLDNPAFFHSAPGKDTLKLKTSSGIIQFNHLIPNKNLKKYKKNPIPLGESLGVIMSASQLRKIYKRDMAPHLHIQQESNGLGLTGDEWQDKIISEYSKFYNKNVSFKKSSEEEFEEEPSKFKSLVSMSLNEMLKGIVGARVWLRKHTPGMTEEEIYKNLPSEYLPEMKPKVKDDIQKTDLTDSTIEKQAKANAIAFKEAMQSLNKQRMAPLAITR